MSPAMGGEGDGMLQYPGKNGTKDRGKFTVVPSRSWGSTIVGVALAHLAGQLETVRLGLEGPYLPFGGPERLAVRVG